MPQTGGTRYCSDILKMHDLQRVRLQPLCGAFAGAREAHHLARKRRARVVGHPVRTMALFEFADRALEGLADRAHDDRL